MTARRRRLIEQLIETRCDGAAIREQIAAARAQRRAWVEDQVEIDLYLALTFGRRHGGNARLWAIGRAAATRVRQWRAELGE